MRLRRQAIRCDQLVALTRKASAVSASILARPFEPARLSVDQGRLLHRGAHKSRDRTSFPDHSPAKQASKVCSVDGRPKFRSAIQDAPAPTRQPRDDSSSVLQRDGLRQTCSLKLTLILTARARKGRARSPRKSYFRPTQSIGFLCDL